MSKKLLAFILVASLIIGSFPISFLLVSGAASAPNLGTITECSVVGDRIFVKGNIKHSVLVSNREAQIAVYKLLPWENAEDIVAQSEPLKVAVMSISFDFQLPCLTIADKSSLYAVAIIGADGKATCISEPKYPDAITDDTTDIGFKGVNTINASEALANHAGSAIVDVYLDKLDKGNKSGHIFNADGDIYYFDRDLIKDLDRKILSYTAMGCDVLLRFLISPEITNIPFCTDSRIWSSNKCIVVDDLPALNAIYGYTYFLMSRYDGGEYGKVSGIILGRGADMPILYNYASLISEDYDTVYARSLALIGLAAAEAAGDGQVSLIVPVGDSLTEKGGIYAERFLSSVAEYISARSKLTFTVMCESIHNPYHIYDSIFALDSPSDDTGEDGETIVYPETEASPDVSSPEYADQETTEIVDSESYPLDTSVENTDEITDSDSDSVSYPESTYFADEILATPEKERPHINTQQDGYYCTDTVDLFLNCLTKLQKKYSALNKGYAWCWYPDENTLEVSLGVCYAYNYMKLATEGADFFAVAFEGEAYDRLHSISHLFKYIDTSRNIKETDYARSVFGIKEWSDIIDGHASTTGVFNVFTEGELQPNISDYVGNLIYMDYAITNNTGGWYEGVLCNSLVHKMQDGEGFIQADLNFNEAGLNQAEIGCIFKSPEPLLLGDGLTFDVMCGENDGSLYEMTVYINCESDTLVSKAVVAGGARCSLSVDVSNNNNDEPVRSIRISAVRITGSGNSTLNLYNVSLNSRTLNDDELSNSFRSIRDHLRTDSAVANASYTRQMIVTVVLVSSFALVAIIFAFANDRRLFKYSNNDR